MYKKIKAILRPLYHSIKNEFKKQHIKKETKRLLYIKKNNLSHKIFYLGITSHSNLGDMAQYYCIHSWLLKNYPNYKIYEFESDVVVDHRFGFIKKLKEIINADDIIVFQSGYTTQDLGGNHDLMHRLIIDNFPNAKILMMPQTIFFKEKENKEITAKSYNKAKNMLFLARDIVSYNIALEMFPDVHVKLFPDIVTSLIGHYNYNYERNDILICRRNDSEKFYSEDQIILLKNKLNGENLIVNISDTSVSVSYKQIRKNLKEFIENIIQNYSKYKLIITDRYHGVIFSLAANTPVIILKTTDHKVITGADWFKGVYDDYVFVANSIDDAYNIAKDILSKNYNYQLNPYFDKNYYDKLKEIIENTIM